MLLSLFISQLVFGVECSTVRLDSGGSVGALIGTGHVAGPGVVLEETSAQESCFSAGGEQGRVMSYSACQRDLVRARTSSLISGHTGSIMAGWAVITLGFRSICCAHHAYLVFETKVKDRHRISVQGFCFKENYSKGIVSVEGTEAVLMKFVRAEHGVSGEKSKARYNKKKSFFVNDADARRAMGRAGDIGDLTLRCTTQESKSCVFVAGLLKEAGVDIGSIPIEINPVANANLQLMIRPLTFGDLFGTIISSLPIPLVGLITPSCDLGNRESLERYVDLYARRHQDTVFTPESAADLIHKAKLREALLQEWLEAISCDRGQRSR